ncbi:hypothetical protein ACH9L7_10045 [Haloferax sp. S1W]|uniref:phage NrS-1 polymerase family protein n=1 Tax=Haloferax sp. S1W TaxID=3377110 RepID=UPI0037CCAB26
MTPPLPTRAALPDALLDRPQWVGWRTQTTGGNETKLPLDVTGGYASATDASTWTTFDEAVAAVEEGEADGVGFVFTDDDPYVGVALDACRDAETGTTEDWAQVIVDRLDSYTEVDPSGTGYRVIVRGSLPPDGDRTGGLELYERARFLPVTGDRVDGTPGEVADRTAELTAIYRAYVQPGESVSEQPPEAEPPKHSASLAAVETPGNDLTDDQVVTRASNGPNGLQFRRLWEGDTTPYDSHDDADRALCSILAFWTGGDPQQMDRLFRDSGLYRNKWDGAYVADGVPYGEQTIAEAIEQASEFYDPSGFSSAVRRTASGHDSDDTGDGGDTDRDRRAGNSTRPGSKDDGGQADHSGGRTDRLTELQDRVDTLLEENERLREELDEERERRRVLEAEVDDEDDGGWSLFDWFK